MDQELVLTLSAQGHRVHQDRNSYTHQGFASNLPAEQEILVNGKPVHNVGLRRNVVIADLLPERVALAVDERGEVLPQEEFQRRWEVYWSGFQMKGKWDDDPIPRALPYLLTVIDETRGSDGSHIAYCDLGFDPHATGDVQQTGKYTTDGELYDVWLARHQQDEARDRVHDEVAAKATLLRQLAADGTIDQATCNEKLAKLLVESIEGAQEVEPDEELAEEPDEVPASTDAQGPAPITKSTDSEVAPCGKKVSAGYVRQHAMRCTKDECKARDAQGWQT